MTSILHSHAFGDAVLALVIVVFGGTIIGLLIHIVRCVMRDEREIHRLAETVRRAREGG